MVHVICSFDIFQMETDSIAVLQLMALLLLPIESEKRQRSDLDHKLQVRVEATGRNGF